MRQLLAITFLIVGAPAVLAQKAGPAPPDRPACSLSAAQAPGISALKLGMTAEQVLVLFPGSKEDPEVSARLFRPADPLGVSSFMVRPGKYPTKGNFPGVSRITFTLLDGRVYTYTVSYNGPEWPHVDNFVAKVVEGTGLPPANAWEAYAGMDTQLKILTCREFEVRVFAGGQGGNLNYVLIKDLEAARTLKDRRTKAGEKVPPQ